jgi:NAD(P)-dependent dehydrogenase (short-subunit alcohol dehydrogenase family)
MMTRAQRDLHRRVVAVTGGARGIGAATARALASAGARVAIGDLDGELAGRVTSEIGGDAIGLHLDVTDLAGFTAFLDQVEVALGPIDVLVNNAGIMPVVEFDRETPASIQRQLDVNLRAVLHGTQQAVRRMRPRGRGHVINVASAAGKMGFAGVATYSATKHAVVGLCEALHYELAGSGIDISCVMPAIVRTELTDGLDDHWLIKSSTPQDVADVIVRTIRRPRLDVMIPPAAGFANRVVRLLPRAVTDRAMVALHADTLMLSAAHSPDRAAYTARITRP